MIGACVQMRFDPLANGLQRAPGDDGVDEAITAAVLAVVFRESQAEKIVGVVRQGEIEAKKHSRNLARLRGVGLQHDSLFDTEPGPSAQELACRGGVSGVTL